MFNCVEYGDHTTSHSGTDQWKPDRDEIDNQERSVQVLFFIFQVDTDQDILHEFPKLHHSQFTQLIKTYFQPVQINLDNEHAGIVIQPHHQPHHHQLGAV